MKCTLHADKPAIGNCHSCGKPYCIDCLKQSGDFYMCPGCNSAAHTPPKAPAPARMQPETIPAFVTSMQQPADPKTAASATAS